MKSSEDQLVSFWWISQLLKADAGAIFSFSNVRSDFRMCNVNGRENASTEQFLIETKLCFERWELVLYSNQSGARINQCNYTGVFPARAWHPL